MNRKEKWYITRNAELLGHIEGLLEAWLDRGTSVTWESRLEKMAASTEMADVTRISRILELFANLDPTYVADESTAPDSLNRNIMQILARAAEIYRSS
jgi:hypothetical protein